MLLLFFVSWIIFNGKITLEIIIFGIVISLLVFLFVCKFLNYNLEKEIRLYKKIPLFVKYLLLLIKEIIKSNIEMCRMTFTRKEIMEPIIIHVKTPLENEALRVILANSITLTPGTITVSLTDNDLYVHCLDKSLADGVINSPFTELLLKIEGKVD